MKEPPAGARLELSFRGSQTHLQATRVCWWMVCEYKFNRTALLGTGLVGHLLTISLHDLPPTTVAQAGPHLFLVMLQACFCL